MILGERSAHQYLPYVAHYPREDVVLLGDGSFMIMGEVQGNPHELASDAERGATSRFLNTLWRQLSDDTLSGYLHLVSTRRYDQLPQPVFYSDFPRQFNRAYRKHILDEVYDKTWFISVLAAPRLPLGNQKEYSRELTRLMERFRWRKKGPPTDFEGVTKLDDTWLTISRTLAEYNVRKLGVRRQNGYLFSEFAETMQRFLTCRHRDIGLTNGPLGNTVYLDRVVFPPGTAMYRLLHPDGERFGTLFGLREYMIETIAGMFDRLLPLRMEFVATQSFCFLPRQQAVTRLARKQNQMLNANDRAFAQLSDIDNALSEVSGGEVARGLHHFSLAVYGASEDDLNRKRGEAVAAISAAGPVVAEESLGNEASYFAQLPGNIDWRTRPGVASTRNLGHLADFGCFPRGHSKGRWGDATLRLRTRGGTAYDFIPHVDENGMTFVVGKTGGGKTVVCGAMLLAMDPYLGDDGIAFIVDKDRANELTVRATGGSYLEIRSGEASGLAPLRGLQNTAADCAFLVQWIKALIQMDGHGPIRPQDEGRIARAVKSVMQLPIHLRSFEGLRQFLGWRDAEGAGVRIERWCKGGSLWWAFDGDEDEIDIATRYVGVDFTTILDNVEVINPAALYYIYRVSCLMDGRRGVLYLDEARAYILHPLFREMVDDILRRGRKNNWVIWLCTQQPEDFLVSEDTFGTTVVEQCQTKICFRDGEASEETYCERMKFTVGEYRAVAEGMLPGSRQFLLKRESGAAIIDFDLTPIRQFVAVLSGRKNTVRYAERLRQQTPNWVETFMDTYETARD